MFNKSFNKIVFAGFLALSLTLSHSGCSNKNGGDGAGEQPLNPDSASNAANAQSCPTGSFRIVNSQNQDVTSTLKTSMYQQYLGHTAGYMTHVATSNNGGVEIDVKNTGSTLKFFKDDIDVNKDLDVKSPLRAAKLVKFEGASSLTLLVGTLTNLQQITVDASTGVPSGAPVVFDALGGVNSIATVGNDIYVATLSGDVAKIPSSTVSSQGGCATVSYVASANVDPILNRSMKAFRVEGANGKVYVLSRNYGLFQGSVGEIVQFIRDFSSNNFLKWKTQLATLNSADGAITNLPSQIENRKLTLMQDITGNGKTVFTPYVAFVDRDVSFVNACNAASPPPACATTGDGWAAFLVNASSGINAYQDSLVGSYEIPPINGLLGLGAPGPLGCPADQLFTSCFRLPNLGFFFKNVVGYANNTVFMRGMWGYAKIDDVEHISPSSTLQVMNKFSAMPVPPPPAGLHFPPLGIPMQASGISQGLQVAGWLFEITGVGCPPSGSSFCNNEKAELKVASPSGLLYGTFDVKVPPFEKFIEAMILGAAHKDSYIMNKNPIAHFERHNMSDGTDFTHFPIPTPVGATYEFTGMFPAVREMDSGADRLLVLYNNSPGTKYAVSAYNSTRDAPADPKSSPHTIPEFDLAAEYPALISPLMMTDDLAALVTYSSPGLPTIKYKIKWAKIDWPTLAGFSFANITKPDGVDFESDNLPFWVRNFEKVDDTTLRLTFLGVSITVGPPFSLDFHIQSVTFKNDGTEAVQTMTVPIATSDFRGFDAYNGKAYVVHVNGDILQYKTDDGSLEKTYPNAFGLSAGQKVLFSSLNTRSGKFYASAVTYGTSFGFKTLSFDPNTNATTHYELNDYFYSHVSKSGTLFGTGFINSNGLEAFDTTKPITAPNVTTGGAAAAGPTGAATGPTDTTGATGGTISKGGGLDADGAPIKTAGATSSSGDGCSLNLFANNGNLLMSIWWLAALLPMAIRRYRK